MRGSGKGSFSEHERFKKSAPPQTDFYYSPNEIPHGDWLY